MKCQRRKGKIIKKENEKWDNGSKRGGTETKTEKEGEQDHADMEEEEEKKKRKRQGCNRRGGGRGVNWEEEEKLNDWKTTS